MRVFKKNKFKSIKIHGGESRISILTKGLKGNDKELLNRFRKVFPDEIVESMFSFLYPELSGVKIFLAKK